MVIHWMLQSYLSWRYPEYYLNNFIYILAAYLATRQWLQDKNIAYQLFNDCFDISYQDVKDIKGTVVPVLRLEVDTNLFIICIPLDMVQDV